MQDKVATPQIIKALSRAQLVGTSKLVRELISHKYCEHALTFSVLILIIIFLRFLCNVGSTVMYVGAVWHCNRSTKLIQRKKLHDLTSFVCTGVPSLFRGVYYVNARVIDVNIFFFQRFVKVMARGKWEHFLRK